MSADRLIYTCLISCLASYSTAVLRIRHYLAVRIMVDLRRIFYVATTMLTITELVIPGKEVKITIDYNNFSGQ